MTTQLPDLPADLDGWRWVHATSAGTPQIALQGPDSWTTRNYIKPEKAIGEARRRVLSTPKPEPEPPAPAAALITAIRPEHIRIDGGTQARAGLDPATVAEYVEAMRDLCYVQNGLDRIPPIVVFHDGASYWLADGFHRLAAYKELQQQASPAPPSAIRAEVRQGTRRDAVLYAAGANADHGLRRTTADKERAVLALLEDEEWSQWSGREIARRCRVSHDFVRNVEERHHLTGRASSARKTADGRTMDTSGIAAANAARAEQPDGADPRVVAMRHRFTTLGYTQFYPSDKGYTAAHPKTGVANYKTWAAVEADIARKEAMAAPRVCGICDNPWGAPGSMLLDGRRLCPSCASATMEEQARQQAAGRQTGLSPEAAAHRALVAAQNELAALGWVVTRGHDGYRLVKGDDAYATDDAGVIALAQLAAERPDATPDELAALVSAIEDTPAADQQPSEIRTFDHALIVLATHGIQPQALGEDEHGRGMLWGVGTIEYSRTGLIALAREYAERPVPTLPPDYADVQARFAALGYGLCPQTHDRFMPNDGSRFVLYPPGNHPGIGNATWYGVTSRLEALEAQRVTPTAIPPDIAQAAAQLALTVETRDDGRLLLYWPDEADGLDAMDPLPPDVMREWIASDAPRQAMARAESLGWQATTHKRAGQTLHAYHRAADGRETAEFADPTLAAGEALRIAARDPIAACACCGKPSAGKRNIGGLLIERCEECATADERIDLKAQLGDQYEGPKNGFLLNGMARHLISWTGGASGAYSYDDAISMLHASATQLRMPSAGAQLRQACERAEQLGATVDYMQQRADGKIPVVPPAGYAQARLWCDAKELASLCASWERNASGQKSHAPVYPAVPENAEAIDIWQTLGDLLRDDPAALLTAARAALDSLVDSDTLATDDYDDLSRRIGDAERTLAEASETAEVEA